jgi:hypothetical protein
MARWRLQDAQKNFSKVVEQAFREGPQTITLAHGRSVTISPAHAPLRSRRRQKAMPSMTHQILASAFDSSLRTERGKGDVGREPPAFA